jgi:predicted transcriptional regulator
MESSLEAIQFLANSANRVAVLAALADGEASRRELEEEVGGSRSTVARILDEAGSRAWVDSEGSRYWLTPLGERMVTGFRSYQDSVEGLQQLGETINQFPPPLLSIDFRHLRDAEVIEPTPEDPAAPFTRAFEVFQEATRYRGLTHTAFPHFTRALREGLDQGRLEDHEGVIEKSFVETIRTDPERSALWRSFIDAGTSWVYDGTVPISFHVIDGQVLVWLGETREEVAGILISENPAVVEWGESLVEEYRSESEPLDEL